MKQIFLNLSIQIAYFLIGFYGMATVYFLIYGFYGKAVLSLLLMLIFSGTLLINKMTLITKDKVIKLNQLVSFLKKREPDLIKLNLILFCLDIEYFKKHGKTLTGFFWIKKQNRPFSNFVKNSINNNQSYSNISADISNFLEENKDIFSLSLLELNAKVQNYDKFKEASENSLLVNLK